jgi:hypothetical protein
MVRGVRTFANYSPVERHPYGKAKPQKPINDSQRVDSCEYVIKDSVSISTGYSVTEVKTKKLNSPYQQMSPKRPPRQRHSDCPRYENEHIEHKALKSSSRETSKKSTSKNSIKTTNKKVRVYGKQFIEDGNYFQTCIAFKSEGFCMKGAECAFVHSDPFKKFGKVEAKLLRVLEKATQNKREVALEDMLILIDKFDKYLPVYKRVYYRYDKNDLFPEF